ncbi:MAG: SgcJ/EcaC family oxidoreductase [Anaerolineae bacterium]
MQDAWNAGDGALFASNFAPDANYTVWTGLYGEGKEWITAAHQQLFDTVYQDTRQKIEVAWIRPLRPDVAIAQLHGGMVNRSMNGHDADVWPKMKPLLILTKENGRWQIAVLQNTPVMQPPAENQH